MLASTHAAMREFGKIENILAAGKIHGGGSRSIEETVARITFAIDAGDWKTLESLMTTINATDRSLDPASAQTLDDLKLALATLFATTEKNQSLDYPPSKARQAEARNDKNYHARSWNAHLLFRAWAAARSGHVEIAKALLAQMGSEVRDPGFPTLNKLLLLTQSLLDFQSGKHEEALARLQSSIDGKELYATHITLMELLLKRGDYPAARDQARWLASHRGRAYAETRRRHVAADECCAVQHRPAGRCGMLHAPGRRSASGQGDGGLQQALAGTGFARAAQGTRRPPCTGY